MGAAAVRLRTAASFLRAHWLRLLGGAALAALFLGNQGFRSLVRNYLELRSLRRELAALEGEEARLGLRLKDLRAGDSALERLARRELGYIKKGETEYRFPPPSGPGG